MKKVFATILGGAAVAAFVTGCDPTLAQVPQGSVEEQWEKLFQENYSSFAAPRNPAPAAYAPSNAPVVKQAAPSRPADDPENAVDRAASGEDVTPVPVAQELKEEPQKNAAPAEEKAPAAPVKEEKAAAPEAKAEAKEAAPAPAGDQDVPGKLYTVKSGDTLSALAKQFYGKASLEDVIFRANSKKLKNRNALRVGMTLVIPEL